MRIALSSFCQKTYLTTTNLTPIIKLSRIMRRYQLNIGGCKGGGYKGVRYKVGGYKVGDIKVWV